MSRRWVAVVWALAVAGIWVGLLCTLPQVLANSTWMRVGPETDLPLADVWRDLFHTIAVLTCLLLTGRAWLLKPTRPQRPWVILLFIPLIAINVLRGPLIERSAAWMLVTLASAMLTGFWEEFLFRGLMQERLAILGRTFSILVATTLFALVHMNYGLLHAFAVAFPIGLAFAVAREHVGMWPLVVVHGLIDFSHDLFVREWAHYGQVGFWQLMVYLTVSLGVLLWPLRPWRAKPASAGV